jgi:hypothetical protein
MANRRYIDFPIASTSGDTDIILIWQDGANKQTTKATFLSGLPENLDELNDVAISGLTNGQILRYDSVTGKWENTDQGNLDLNDLNDVSIVSPSNGQVLVYNSSTSKWENSSGGFVPYVGAVTTVDLGAQGLRAGYVRFDTTVAGVPNEQGLMFWDADDETVDIILNGYTMKIGEDLFYPVKNQTGSTIAKGVAVRFAGTLGASGRLLIEPFIANGTVPSSRFMGVTAEEILNGDDGKVLYFGRVRGINTDAFNEGDILYASTTVAGGYQTAIPVAPNNIVQVAAVVTKHVNNGTIFVRPTLGSNINTDEGVKIVSVADKNLLQYQSGTSLWENKSLAQVLGGTSTQFVKGDGSLDSTSYGTGTVTSVGLSSATSGVTIGSSPVTTSGTITLAIATASGSQNGLLSSTDWTSFNNKQNALTNPVTGTGTSGQIAYFTGTSAISSESNLFWDATNDRLGIGTAIPALPLTIYSTNAATVYQTPNTGTGAGNGFYVGHSADVSYIYNYNNFPIVLATNNAEGVRLFQTTQNVHIGPTPASDNGARLQLSGFSGAVNQNKGIKLTNTAGTIVGLEVGASNDSYIGTISGSNFSIRCNNNPVITVDTNLNVGIGTVSPNLSAGSAGSSILTVSATISERNGILELNGTRTTNTFVSGYVRFFNNGAATPLADIRAIRGSSDTLGDLAIETSGAERIRVTSNGLTFNGDTAAANALDDYEEGTWTPTITGGYTGITYSFQNGWYRKIGSAVIVSGRVSFTGTANGAGISMACPFTQGPTGYGGGGIPYSDIAVITNTSPYITNGSSSVLFYTTGTGAQIGSGATNVVNKWLSFVITMSV